MQPSRPGQPILHSCRHCPYSMRVRIVLALKGIDYAVLEERPGEWSGFMVKNVPHPRVPVLVHDGRIICESNAINEYLDGLQPEPELVPFNRSDAEHMKEWWAWCEEEFSPPIEKYENEQDSREWFKGKTEVERQLEHLETALKRKHFLLGGKMTLADIAVIPFIAKIQSVRRDPVNFRLFPKVKVWADQILGKPFFTQQVMKNSPFADEFPSVNTDS